VGLGNPGAKYSNTRHNIGFMALDRLSHRLNLNAFKNEHKSEIVKARVLGEDIVLIKPQSFMNLSGEALILFLNFYKIKIPSEGHKLLTVHDDIDSSYRSLRYQTERGHGGHNGIRNIHQLLGHNKYDRLKLGVGRPSNSRQDVASYVLESFSNEEQSKLPEYLDLVCESIESYIESGFQNAATNYNQKGDPKE